MSIMRYKRMISYWGVTTQGGGGKGSSPAPVIVPATPPPPPPEAEAKMTEFTDEEADKLQRKALTQGAKSLQIPLATAGSATLGTA